MKSKIRDENKSKDWHSNKNHINAEIECKSI